MMERQPINVLLIEDNPGDARLISELLAEVKVVSFHLERVERLQQGLDRLTGGGIDVVLLDLSLPDSQGLDTFISAHKSAGSVPIMVLTGLDDETIAINAVRKGAQDYLFKGQVDGELMSHAICYAIERQKMLMELDGYAHTVSHDLKNPLAAIKIASDTIVEILRHAREKDADKDEMIRDVLDIAGDIDRTALKANALVNDLLALAEAGHVPADISVVNVGELVDRILLERREDIKKKSIRTNRSEDLGLVTASETHIYLLFANLIGNAIKHNDSSEPAIEVSYLGYNGDGSHRYVIKDNGSGVPPEDAKNIFKPFYKSKSNGMGIGLATVEKTVKLYGGEISVHSNGGACFEFSIRDLSEDNHATVAFNARGS